MAREAVAARAGSRAGPNEFVPNQFVLKLDPAFGLGTLQRSDGSFDKDDNVDFATPNFISEVVR
jgi:hypothetical protein